MQKGKIIFFNGVSCPLEENLRRAKERASSHEVIEWQLSNLIPQEPYDLTIDTIKKECVDEIVELLAYPEKFKAFKTLWLQHTE